MKRTSIIMTFALSLLVILSSCGPKEEAKKPVSDTEYTLALTRVGGYRDTIVVKYPMGTEFSITVENGGYGISRKHALSDWYMFKVGVIDFQLLKQKSLYIKTDPVVISKSETVNKKE